MSNVYFKKELPERSLVIAGAIIPVETLSRDVGVIKLDAEAEASLIAELNKNVGTKGLVRINEQEYEELKKKPREIELPNSQRLNPKLSLHPSSQRQVSLPANAANQPAAPATPEPVVSEGTLSTLRKFVPRTMRQADVSRLDAGSQAAT